MHLHIRCSRCDQRMRECDYVEHLRACDVESRVGHHRRREREERAVTRFVVVAFASFLLYVGTWDLLRTLTERACLRAGYTGYRVTLTWGRYCSARVDNTDVVLPLADAQRRPRR